MLLLSLASPDESSLVSCFLNNLLHYIFFTTSFSCLIFIFKYISVVRFKYNIYFQKYEVEFLLQQQWYDPRLRYSNQSHYDFLNAIHHHEDIWLPDTYFIMHGDFKVSFCIHYNISRTKRNIITYISYLKRWDRGAFGNWKIFLLCIIYLTVICKE